MMDEPWFRYERSCGRHRITPRNGKGWASLLLLIAFLGGVPMALVRLGAGPLVPLAWLPVVLVAMLLFFRFARARSEMVEGVVDSAELAEFREWRRRQGKP
jgi:hypothetical protein